MQHKKVFITWTRYTKRADYLSKYLFKCDLVNINSESILAKKKFFKPIFYVAYFYKTLAYLFKIKPHLVIAQCGPVFCPLAVLIYSKFNKIVFLIDAHTGTWTRFSNNLFLRNYIFNKATKVLVHNYATLELCGDVKNTFVLYDYPKIADLKRLKKNKRRMKVVYVPSHVDKNDVILLKLLKFFKKYSDIELYVTGNVKIQINSDNIVYTGFLDSLEFSNLLSSCNLQILLYTRTDYQYVQSVRLMEAVSYEVPLLLTDAQVNKEILVYGGAVYIDYDYDYSLFEKRMIEALKNYNELLDKVIKSKQELYSSWEVQSSELTNFLEKQLDRLGGI